MILALLGMPICPKGDRDLIVEDHIQQGTVDFQSAVVLDESKLSKPIHEEVHARPRRPDHLRENFLTDLGNHVLRPAFLSEMREQQKDARQSLFAGVEKLIDEVGLDANVARQKKRDE